MNIEEAIKSEDMRIICGSAWLYWDNFQWVVLHQPADISLVLYQGQSFKSALDALVRKE